MLSDFYRRLGGEIIETDEWDERVTHVVAHVDGKKESMSEKVIMNTKAIVNDDNLT